MAQRQLHRNDTTRQPEPAPARIGAHGTHAVSAARGTELSVVDCHWRTLSAFDGGVTVDAYVAGRTALLCAKSYRIHDQLDPTELRRNAEWLRPKDFADLYRLLLVITPEDAKNLFAQGIADPTIREAVAPSSMCTSPAGDAGSPPSKKTAFDLAADTPRPLPTAPFMG